MNNFFDLVGFEYKKIFCRRSTILCLATIIIVMVILSVVSVTRNQYWHYSGNSITTLEAMKLDRETIRNNAGVIDENFVREAIEQNAVMIADDNNYLINEYGRHLKDEAYIKYVLPYQAAVDIINTVYETNYKELSTDGREIFNINGTKAIDTLTSADANGFYAKVKQSISDRIINWFVTLSENERVKHEQMLSQVKIPFDNDYNEGYTQSAALLEMLALVLLVVSAVSISPIFAGEYQQKTAQLVLTSKHGKSTVIFAKIFTGTTFILATSVFSLFGVFLSVMAIHGFSGYDTPIQTYYIYMTYPLTMLQAILIYFFVTILIILFFTILVMLFSAMFKTPFLAVIASFVVIFLPGMLFISSRHRLIYQLVQLFPSKGIQFGYIFSNYFFEIIGVVFTPATFYIMFSVIMSAALIPIVYRFFKNHQVV